MSFCIQKGEDLAAAFGRIAAEEMDLVLEQLHRNGGEPVHSARKSLKRLRALLRSLRVTLPKELYCAENERLGEAGRQISPLRDTHVQLQALNRLHLSGNPTARKLRHSLLQHQTELARKMPRVRKSVRAMLDASRDQMAAWPLQAANPKALAQGLRRIYKQGRKAARGARNNPTPENFHLWRKKAKALGYAFELLENLGPGKISKLLRRTNCLTDLLGDDHDLFVLLQGLRTENNATPDDGFLKLADRIARKRAKLQKRAFKTGDKIYHQKPAAFERSIRCLLLKAQHSDKAQNSNHD